MKKRISVVVAIFVVMALFATGCATQPLTIEDGPGFWTGLWHGVAAPVAFIVSLFKESRMYESPNSGVWYDFGFLIGLSVWGGGGAAASRKR